MKKYGYVVIIIVGVLIFIFGSQYYSKKYHENIQKNPKMYCYDMFYGVPNAALLLEDLDYAEEYIGFHENHDGEKRGFINFPLISTSIKQPVYIIDTLDLYPQLIEIVSYYNRGHAGGSFFKGYTHSSNLYFDPPPLKKKDISPK